jgi:antitoxin component of RelBE/YafQ-DinJ toxin-antitoxin module
MAVLGRAILKLALNGKIDQKIILEAKSVMTERGRAMFSEWVPGGDWTPNETTLEAIRAAENGEVTKVENVDALFKELNDEGA